MNPALPALLLLSLAGLLLRRRARSAGAAWTVIGLAAMALLSPALWLSDGIASPSASLGQLAPWQATADSDLGNPEMTDVTFQVEPWLLYLRSELRAGRLPFWNPHQSSGAPFWGNGSSAPLFPLHLLFAALPVQAGLVFLAWLRVVIGGFGCWKLGRQLGLSPQAAMLAALIYPLSGRLTSFLLFPMANGLALVPWVFLGVERLAAGRGGFRLLAVAGGLQLLAGHPETAVFTALAAALYLAVRGTAGPPWVTWGRFAGAWALGGAVAAVHLLPLASTLFATDRWQQWDPGDPMPLLRIFTLWLRFFLPDAFGNAVDGSWWGPYGFLGTTVYAGSLAVPLAAAGLAGARKDRRLRALAAVLVVTLLAAYHFPGFRQLLQALPVIQKGLHHYLLLGVELSLALLAGAGLDRWKEGRGRWVLAGVALSASVIAAGWWRFAGVWEERGQIADQALWTAVALGLAGAVASGLLLDAARRQRLAALLLLAAVLDLVAAHARTNPGLSAASLYPQTGAITFLSYPDRSAARFAASGSVLRPNAAMVYGLYDVRGDDSLKLSHYEALYAQELGGGHPTYFQPLSAWESPWLDRLGVRWVVTDPGSQPLAAGWSHAYSGADAEIWERPNPLPLVRFANPREGDRLEVIERSPGRWKIAWEAASPALVVVAETWEAGWRAEVNGQPQPVERVDGVLLGVRVGPGTGRATVRQRPVGLLWGAALSLFGIVFIGFVGGRLEPASPPIPIPAVGTG